MSDAAWSSFTPAMCCAAYCKTGGGGSPALDFARANDSAAIISFLVATHSNGFTSRPASSRSIGIVSSRRKRSAPNICIRAECERNGYIVKNTETHFGQCPHQESERFRLQLLKAS